MTVKNQPLSCTLTGFLLLALCATPACNRHTTNREQALPENPQTPLQAPGPAGSVTMFLAGDVMLGRGIDQILPHPGDPLIHEPYVNDAAYYVELAERANGPMPGPVDYAYVWGDALEMLERLAPDLRLVNLETSITDSDDYWAGKASTTVCTRPTSPP
jgi:hypothetical protein